MAADKRARALRLIGRVEQQELDRRRLELQRVEGEIDRTVDTLRQQADAWAGEARAANGLPDGQRLMARFAQGDQLRRDALKREQTRLEAERARCHAAVTEQRTTVRRWERSAEHAFAEVAAERARGEALALDELAVLRHAHRGTGRASDRSHAEPEHDGQSTADVR